MPTGQVVDAASLFGQNPEQVAAGQVPRRRVVPAADLFTPTEFQDSGGLASDAVSGFVKGRGRTVVGLAELLTRALDAGTSTDIEEALAAIQAEHPGFDEVQEKLEPTTTAQKVGDTLGSMAEFGAASAVKTPATIARLAEALGPIRKAALATGRAGVDTAAVRSVQEGELETDPREIGLGAASGGVGYGLGRAVGAAGRWLKGRAPKTAAKLFTGSAKPKGVFHKEKNMDALQEILDQGEMPVGNIREIAKALRLRSSALKGKMDTHQADVSFHTEDIRPLYDDLLAEIEARSAQGIRGETPFDTNETNRLRELADELVDLARVHGSRRIPREDLERKRAAWQKVYDTNLDTPGTSRAMTKLGADRLTEFLNATDPERAGFTEPYSRSLGLAKSARAAKADEPYRSPTGIGEAGAVRNAVQTGVGALVGGTAGTFAAGPGMGTAVGTTIGALSTPTIVRFLRSPLFLSLSAREQNRVGRFLMNTNPDNARAAFSALGVELAPEGVEE